MNQNKKKHHICGGGIGGLSSAFFLIENGVAGSDIYIYDSSDVFGGLIDLGITYDKNVSYDTHFNRKYGVDTYINSKYMLSKILFNDTCTVWDKIVKDGIPNNSYAYIVDASGEPYTDTNATCKNISSLLLFLFYYIFFNNSSISFGTIVPDCLKKSALYQNIQVNGGYLDTDSASNWLSLFIYGVDEFVRVPLNGYSLIISPLLKYLTKMGVNFVNETEVTDICFYYDKVISITLNGDIGVNTIDANVILTVSATSMNTSVIQKLFTKNVIDLSKSRIDSPIDKWCFFRLTSDNSEFIKIVTEKYPLAINNMEDIVLTTNGMLIGVMLFMKGSYFNIDDIGSINMMIINPSIDMAESLVGKTLNKDMYLKWVIKFFGVSDNVFVNTVYEFEFDDGVSDRLYRNNTTSDYIKPYNDKYKNLVFVGQYVRTDYRFNLTVESVIESSKHAVEKLILDKQYNGESICTRFKKFVRFIYRYIRSLFV